MNKGEIKGTTTLCFVRLTTSLMRLPSTTYSLRLAIILKRVHFCFTLVTVIHKAMSAKYEVLKGIQGRDILATTNYKFCRPVRTFFIVHNPIQSSLLKVYASYHYTKVRVVRMIKCKVCSVKRSTREGDILDATSCLLKSFKQYIFLCT